MEIIIYILHVTCLYVYLDAVLYDVSFHTVRWSNCRVMLLLLRDATVVVIAIDVRDVINYTAF